MIRPVTLVCWILSLSAGLYLYRAKHEVELMDQHIDLIAKQTADLRVESRGLLDEWIRLGEPEQLHRYSDEYLGLQPISPAQFARLSDLPAKLPPPQADPAEETADVVAQSSGDTTNGASTNDAQSSGDPAGAAQVDPADPSAAGSERETAAGVDDLPVPPIPPARIPVASTTPPAVTALPLQARPVTPRLADSQPEPETVKTRTGALSQGPDELHTDTARGTPTAPAEPHQGPPVPISAQPAGQPSKEAHGLPPSQGPRDAPGLPPLQAQGPTRDAASGSGRVSALGQSLGRNPAQAPGQAQGQGQAAGQAPGPVVLRPSESRTAEIHPIEPSREVRPADPQPVQRQATEPHSPGPRIARQGQAQTEQAQITPAPGGSLLGMSRSSVPLPLPAPTPVNATWSGPAGTGSIGPGR
jgi:hypothetical protein